MTTLGRFCRGLCSVATGFTFPLGGWWLDRRRRLYDPARREHGLAIILPGTEGRGPLNWSVARGLQDGGFPGATLVHDWTTGLWPLFAFHLRAENRARRRAATLARLITDYQDKYPGRPVHLLAHSGGAAIAIWALETLPAGRMVNSVVLFGPSLSQAYNLAPALRRTEQGIRHFWSPLDMVFLAAGTLVAGTSDGRHSVSAGFCGFSLPPGAGQEDEELYRDRLWQRRYHPRMLGQFHWGGHLGWANRVFIAESVAPMLCDGNHADLFQSS
ncbi:alpha/beta hydrolase [Zavarzinella formosa]|uniref:alpha/beta hydrolase n=1 Tax=Zavarzinella formosa TaxID=360055 RepID=UPI0002D79D85|nr:alpha/beta hydrolase [Zavarzinella formosa]